MFKNITIIGCGLIGSSLLRTLNKKKISKNITIYDKSKEVLSYLRQENLSIDISSDVCASVKEADIIIIATPLSSYKEILLSIKDNLKNKFITSNDIFITRERHRQHLRQCLDHLENFNKKNEAEDFDKAAEDLRLATRHLGMIVGKVDVEEILGSIFNDFCIGK